MGGGDSKCPGAFAFPQKRNGLIVSFMLNRVQFEIHSSASLGLENVSARRAPDHRGGTTISKMDAV